jgi:hypothetical protein
VPRQGAQATVGPGEVSSGVAMRRRTLAHRLAIEAKGTCRNAQHDCENTQQTPA